jgi:crotonobetainyl-CoA:carnitine CoA-transferase CaiB-like acyl-CoA transferase
MNPRFVLSVSGGERLAIPDGEDLRPRADPSRIGIGEDDLVTICAYYPILAEIFAQYPAAEWAAVAAQANVALQVVRSPEAAFADPSLHADGCVVDLDDPELGRLTQVGRVVELTRSAGRPSVPAVAPGTHTEAVRSETPTPSVAPRRSPAPLAAPLTGIRVLDLGLAVAGPFGCQVLADLGAEVIKINTLHDGYWHSNHIAMGANRGKRSLAVNLKHPDGMAILRELVPTADVVHTNMRYDAAQRLGVDEASLRALNPTMIYCHTRGFERGDRELLPGNDQTGGALAGGQWEDGGLSDGGRPIWSLTTLGDTGNGFLSAIGVVMALYDRERTGEGQRVDTSILYAHLLNVSAAMLRNGEPIERPRLDSQQLGLAPTYRIYATADAWVCVGAWTAEQIAAFAATGATDAERTAWFAERRADSAIGALAALGVPIERCDEGFAMRAFDDSDFIARRWVADFRHRRVGRVDMAGLAVDFSDTPGVLGLGPVLVGQETREILRDLGHDDAQIDAWCAAKVVFDDPEPT